MGELLAVRFKLLRHRLAMAQCAFAPLLRTSLHFRSLENLSTRGPLAQLARALHSHCRGRRFKSGMVHFNNTMIKNLKQLKPLPWHEVFSVWKQTEGSDPSWQQTATDVKGWDSWEQWRTYKTDKLGFPEREWALYEIERPMTTVPAFLVGPFKTWQQLFEKKMKQSFKDIAEHHTAWAEQNKSITYLQAHFPEQTQMIGMYYPKMDAVIVFEGHHRAAAIALSVHQESMIEFSSNPMIALTTIDTADYEMLKELATQSSKKEDVITGG